MANDFKIKLMNVVLWESNDVCFVALVNQIKLILAKVITKKNVNERNLQIININN